jgi:hypothetical protein
MRFKQWLEAAPQQWLNAPSKWQMLGAAGKAAADFVPVVGPAMNAYSGIMGIMKMIRQNQDVTKQVMQMMHQQDVNGAPASALDLDDEIAAMLSDPSKQEIAKQIIDKLKTINGQNPDPRMADKIAVQYVRNIMGRTGVA